MPIFEYQCDNCGSCFELLVLAGGQAEPKCPECGSRQASKMMSAGSVRPQGIPKGSGGFKPPACGRLGR